MDDTKNNLVENNFYFYVSTLCKDGSHEYTDGFLVASSENLLSHDEKWEIYQEVILDWNYNHCVWNGSLNSYWDGERLISVRSIKAMTYDDYKVVNEYLPSFDIDTYLYSKDLIEGEHEDG